MYFSFVLDKNNKAMVFYTTLFNHSIGTLKQYTHSKHSLQTLFTCVHTHTPTHDSPPQHLGDYMLWYVRLRTCCWAASDACPAQVTPTFAWREIIADVIAELLCQTLLTILTIHSCISWRCLGPSSLRSRRFCSRAWSLRCCSSIWSSLCMFRISCIDVLNREVWRLLLPNGGTMGIIAEQNFGDHTL